MKKVVIFGAGVFGEVVHFYLTHDSPYEVVAFSEHCEKIRKKNLFDLPIISFETIESNYPPSDFAMFIAIPYSNMNKTRSKIFKEAKNMGYELITYISSKAVVWENESIGENCFILENNVIQPFVTIGDDVILWSGNHIGHHSVVDDHCFISSHAVISGNVKINNHCFIGVNATIRDGVTISKECVIGAGSLILQDTKEREVYATEHSKPMEKTSDMLKHI